MWANFVFILIPGTVIGIKSDGAACIDPSQTQMFESGELKVAVFRTKMGSLGLR